ncbi:putative RNA-directed DNA polymerase from transposon X-element, partial [Araneus ventricosus]
FIYEILPFLLL